MAPDLSHPSAGAVVLGTLRQGRWLGEVSLGLWLVGALVLAFARPGGPADWAWLAAQAAGLPALHAALRVRLDLSFFEELYRPGCDLDAFDAALVLLAPRAGGRPLAERARGALRWWRRLARWVALQGLLAGLALGTQALAAGR